MARGPRGEVRPDDPAQAAVAAVRIALGEVAQQIDPRPGPKNPAAVALGRLGGKKGGSTRAAQLSPERRSEIARLAAAVRWNKNGHD